MTAQPYSSNELTSLNYETQIKDDPDMILLATYLNNILTSIPAPRNHDHNERLNVAITPPLELFPSSEPRFSTYPAYLPIYLSTYPLRFRNNRPTTHPEDIWTITILIQKTIRQGKHYTFSQSFGYSFNSSNQLRHIVSNRPVCSARESCLLTYLPTSNRRRTR
jgi:hypothetical protein